MGDLHNQGDQHSIKCHLLFITWKSTFLDFPDENGRVKFLEIHTAKMKEHKLLVPDVDLTALAAKTKNFTGAEIKGLVWAAQSTAMNRFIQLKTNFEIDPEAAENIVIGQEEF